MLVVYDSKHRLHLDPSRRHPEDPSRAVKVLEALAKSGFSTQMNFTELSEPELEVLISVHDAGYVEYIRRESAKGFHYIDLDTYVTEHTYSVAASYLTTTYHEALRSLESGELVLVIPRPGGHHAGRSGRALGAPTLGFCIFNYVAAAAIAYLRRVNKVLIIDFDAHHGNGTQEIFWSDGRVVHVDLHQDGIYPGTGDAMDVGSGAGAGKMINIPLQPNAGDETFMWVLSEIIVRIVEVFKPDAIAVSAGFDAYLGDPLTSLAATKITYGNIGAYLGELLAKGVTRSVVSVVEGGYGDGLVAGLLSYIGGLLSRCRHPDNIRAVPEGLSKRTRDSLRANMSRYWGIDISF
ncbi:MAG: hypothetical protein QW705_00960 [Zestosphaera sp.]